ncbi:GntR family transcriptional regulator [Amaricoccus macauensis]|uniref:GntR family transcriptional regulator n=1 Tax=Amaricoccus macauensis TaxID=57001 RepID=UPI003C798237
MTGRAKLSGIEPIRIASVTELVFAELYQRVVTLDLPPGSRISEADVAKQMGVSRQPVRDAFYRLSQLGFIEIRPQRATLVSRISTTAVLEARFLRTALEVETVRVACEKFGPDDLAVLDEILERQKAALEAGNKAEFHAIDDELHRAICIGSDLSFAWDLIQMQKAHMDRVRFLSLSFASEQAFADHVEIVEAIRSSDTARAVGSMRAHLGRIEGLIEQIRNDHAAFFKEAME